MRRNNFIFLFFVFAKSVFSQTIEEAAPFNLSGRVQATGKPLEAVNIVVSKDGKQISNYTTTKNGKFNIEISQSITRKNNNYLVVFSKPGFVTKMADINTFRPEDDYDGIPYELSLSVTMLATQYSNVSINRPFGKIIWLPSEKVFDFDEQYAKSIEKEEMALAKDPDAFLKEYEKKQTPLTTPDPIDVKYESAIDIADAAFNAKNYEIAKTSYKDALKLKPNERYPNERILEVERLLSISSNSNKENEKYNSLIIKAEKAMSQKDYPVAKLSYSEALQLKPEEVLLKNKLKEIDLLIANIESVANEKVKYDVAIAKANAAFNTKKYEEAKLEYLEASRIKPVEQFPKNKLKEIQTILANIATDNVKIEKEKSEEIIYNAAINKADAAFNSKDYERAKKMYKEALIIKPNEKYPTGQIIKIDGLIASTIKNNSVVKIKTTDKNNSVVKIKTTKKTTADPAIPINENVAPLFDGAKVFSIAKEKQKIQEEKRKLEKKKAQNLSVKYETRNVSTSLMDAVDAFDKKNRNK